MKIKTTRFGFVLTQDERVALTRLAELEGGLSEAATVRRLIRRAARDSGVWQGKVNNLPPRANVTTPAAG